MYFALCELILLIVVTTNQSLARKIRIHRDISGIDHFEVLEDDDDNICTTAAKVAEFCTKYGAVNVESATVCSRLHCRCNSTRPTFLVQDERCVEDENVSHFLKRGSYPGCKYHLVIEDDKTNAASSRCERSPVPLLLAGTSDQRHFSVCTEHASQKVISCKPDWSNSLYYNKGRWRKVWTRDSSQPSSSDSSLRSLLTKLSSNASVWKGFFVFLLANCTVYPEIDLIRLRGQPPSEEVQACLLLKISGSRSWILKSHQMNFTQSMETNRTQDKNDLETNLTQTRHNPTTSSNETEIDGIKERSSSHLTTNLLGAFYGLLVFLIMIIACWLFREECVRRRKGRDGEGRTRTQRNRSIGNPTYERGLDNSLDLTPATDPSPYAVSPYAEVYQPIVENTRPHNENGSNNIYETLKSVKENSLLRRASYSLNQSLNRTTTRPSSVVSPYQNVELFSETQMTSFGPLTEGSDFASGPKSSAQRECNSTPVHSTHSLRSLSEVSGNEGIALNGTRTENCVSVASNSNCSSLDSNEKRDIHLVESKQRPEMKSRVPEEDKGLPVGKTKVDHFIGTCPSNWSSWRQKEESFIGSKFVQLSSSLSSTPEEFQVRNFKENSKASEASKAVHQTSDSGKNISFEGGTICDSLNDRSSDCHLSDLEFVEDSDCSEYDETENRSDRFYYVLEGPDPTPTL